jgi:hypothetical protein
MIKRQANNAPKRGRFQQKLQPQIDTDGEPAKHTKDGKELPGSRV